MIDLTQYLRETQGGRYQCPLCDARRGLSFDPDEGDSGLWHCFSCDAGGDGVDLYMILHDADVAEALDALGIDRSSSKSGSIKRKERQAPIPTAPDRSDAEWKERGRAWLLLDDEEVKDYAIMRIEQIRAQIDRKRDAFDHWQAEIDDLLYSALHEERVEIQKIDRLDTPLPEL